MPEIIITCVSDNSEFPKEVHDYLLSELERHKQHKKGKNMQVSKDLIILRNSEIIVGGNTRVPKEMVKWILQSFLKSDPSRFKDYEVVELADTFTIGRVLHRSKMEMYTCEICGYFTPYFEELHTQSNSLWSIDRSQGLLTHSLTYLPAQLEICDDHRYLYFSSSSNR